MVVWTLVITITSAMDHKAHDVYIVASLSGDQKQHTPIKIKKAERIFCLKKDVGEVNVPVRDLLGKGIASDVEPKVMSHEVRSSSEGTMAVLDFSYEFGQQFPGGRDSHG
ncbi:hypothetical protein ACJRO7_010982 [Eucalyptus globulus]|uniref:Uncharacterized protein n=1 Tax=Eucalyptus globulus TaxID=34317 RepID=A0ABD3LEK6_EUCGL